MKRRWVRYETRFQAITGLHCGHESAVMWCLVDPHVNRIPPSGLGICEECAEALLDAMLKAREEA